MKKYILFIALSYTILGSSQTLVDFYTSMGDFRVEMREDLMPITAGNFMKLSDKKFYDGLIFHRVIAGFVIQGGDPLGNGSGGPGFTIQDEFHLNMNHDSAGVIAMAKTSAPNSAGSQFYFTLAPQPNLDQRYSVFGSCIQGLQTILDIGLVQTNGDDKPLTPVIMDSIRVQHPTGITYEADLFMALEVFPNPFSEQSYIRYEVKEAGPLKLHIYDLQGRLVQSLLDKNMSPGIYDSVWDGEDIRGNAVSSGMYLLVIQGVDGTGMKRLVKR